MEDNWNKIENIYGEYSLDLIHLVEIVPSHFVNEKHEEEVRKFYANHPNPLLSEPIGKFCNKSKFVSSFFNNMNSGREIGSAFEIKKSRACFYIDENALTKVSLLLYYLTAMYVVNVEMQLVYSCFVT
ncbi:unnamed protein product [Rotaria magnacalcarata]|uniref:Uncharacterized protein n=1 Tax=Rotaria magnacalcarata TaxID=392030 RepID=A0A8S2JGT4_9BILA|nr:unnamed protein product [Rotaria magnacalcarata]CAF4014115.1 unnamed protein product [Rotaria magnacalcarata]